MFPGRPQNITATVSASECFQFNSQASHFTADGGNTSELQCLYVTVPARHSRVLFFTMCRTALQITAATNISETAFYDKRVTLNAITVYIAVRNKCSASMNDIHTATSAHVEPTAKYN